MQDQQEIDYLSDVFLEESEDVRPGLLSRGAKRKVKSEKKVSQQLAKSKRIKLIENEAREKGLSEPISSDNKGFAMLRKMGYEEGTALGKSGDGSTAPIPLVLKDGKTGLGRKKFVSEREVDRKVMDAQRLSDFRLRKQASVSERKILSDLRKSRLACQQLDTTHGQAAPLANWYWPEELLPTKGQEEVEAQSSSEEDEDEVDMEPAEQLQWINAHLRESYFFCIWCGTTYQDEADMLENCPGDSEQDHA